jgi:pimeloyl-ACP methyl ester carboxylesterase
MKPLLRRMRKLIRRRPLRHYDRQPPLILVNGLAEQSDSWFCNLRTWRQHFDVHTPNILAYDAEAIHRRIHEKLPIDIDYLVEQLRLYLDLFVQRPPYFLVANSMGGKVAVELAARYPQLVQRLALLCPSGLGTKEQLPIVEGVRRGHPESVVHSVFFREVDLNPELLGYFRSQFANRRWRSGLLRTIQCTKRHSIRHRLAELTMPTLLVLGEEDRIIDSQEAITAAEGLAHVRTIVLPKCGHAPQVERAKNVNQLVTDFMLPPERKPANGHTRPHHPR